MQKSKDGSRRGKQVKPRIKARAALKKKRATLEKQAEMQENIMQIARRVLARPPEGGVLREHYTERPIWENPLKKKEEKKQE